MVDTNPIYLQCTGQEWSLGQTGNMHDSTSLHEIFATLYFSEKLWRA